MVKKSYIFFIFFCLLGINTYAQIVRNIGNSQEQSTVIVSYDLETKSPCKVNLFVSIDAGKTWQGPLKKVIGDVGNNLVSGSHSITWNVLEEFQELRGDNIMFQVRAEVNTLETVIIGNQEWTKKNLNVSKYRNGDIIPEVKDPKKWAALTTGAWCYYDNDSENGKMYGKLYNWYAVNDPRGLAPEGFHIPSDMELNIVKDLKKSYGFTGIPGGFRTMVGSFNSIGIYSYWWSSSKFVGASAWSRYLKYHEGIGDRVLNYYTYGFSVLCIKD